MKLVSKVSMFMLLVLLCIGPMTSMAAETGDSGADVKTVTEHNELCVDVNATSYQSSYFETVFELDEVNSSITLDFDAEVLNVTQDGSTADLSDVDISWEYFQFGANEVSTSTGSNISVHDLELNAGMTEVTIFWKISLEATNSVSIDSFCVDGAFSLHVEHAEDEDHGSAEEGNPLLTFALTILMTLSIPAVVLVVFNKLT